MNLTCIATGFWMTKTRKLSKEGMSLLMRTYFIRTNFSAESACTGKLLEISKKATFEEISENDVANRNQSTSVEVESELEPSTPSRKSSRISVQPDRYSPSLHYLLLTNVDERECYNEATQGNNSIEWELAMKDEMTSLQKNKMWSLIKLLEGKKALQNKWVYRLKEEFDGRRRYKARLMVKGFQQKQGIDFIEIFSPIVKMTTIRVILSIVATKNLHLE